MGFDPSDTVFHLYLHWRELVDELAEALVDGKFPIRVRPISALIQFIAVTAVDCAQTASDMDEAGRLHDALGELEADRQLVVERLSGFSSVFNLMLFEVDADLFAET